MAKSRSPKAALTESKNCWVFYFEQCTLKKNTQIYHLFCLAQPYDEFVGYGFASEWPRH